MNFDVTSTANIGRAAVVPAIRDTDHEALGVVSRDSGRADDSAEEFGVAHRYDSSDEPLADGDIDAVSESTETGETVAVAEV